MFIIVSKDRVHYLSLKLTKDKAAFNKLVYSNDPRVTYQLNESATSSA